MRTTLKSRVAVAAALAAAAAGVAAGPASAIVIPNQVDPFGMSTHRASTAGLVTYTSTSGGVITGNVKGAVTYNAPIADFTAGCARVRVGFRTGNGTELNHKFSPGACSNNGLIPAIKSFDLTYSNSAVRKIRLYLQVKQFNVNNDQYSTVATQNRNIAF
jgi:hypothetical protein